jgi:adenylate cyclase
MASAPVLNSQGRIVGAVEADISAQDIITQLHKLLMFGITALCISSGVSILLGYILARSATHSLALISTCVKEISDGHFNARVMLKTHDEFNKLALTINDMAYGLQERERLKTGFARYVSQHALEKLLQSESYLKLEGERRKVTILFSDIRHFTRMSEQLAPEDVVGILNAYFSKMIEVIFRNHGTLDKFLGDGLMVEFGAPLEDPRQEINAVTAALEMQVELTKLRDKWEKEGKPHIEIGIGIHTGVAIVGNIGSEIRTEYTAIGDTVNIASRLQLATKTLKTPILISEETFKGLPPELFKYKNLGKIPLSGRTGEITVYAIY